MTVTRTEAYQAMLKHHGLLSEGVAHRAAAVQRSASAGSAYQAQKAELVAYLGDEVIPHALAEEQTIYPAAAERPALAETVREMIDEHRRLTTAVEDLATADSGEAAAATATGIAGLFAAHVAKENDVLLPPLVEDDTVDLVDLLQRMHHLTEAPPQETRPGAGQAGPEARTETAAALLSLLLEAATGLADAGEADRACRLVARAWAALRVTEPVLAVRVTAALHRLARQATAEPVTLRTAPAGSQAASVDGVPAAGSDPEADRVLDVRPLAPAQRHETIFAAYTALAPGAGFVLVNDHDPKPLRYQFEVEHTGEFTWDYIEAGPRTWRVRIGRPAVATVG